MRHWIPLIALAIVAASIVALGLSERLLGHPNQIVCDTNCREIADLAAQNSMAAAAWAALTLGVLSLAATVGGIYFVRASLKEARTATRIASEQVTLSRLALISTERAFVFFNGCSWLSYKRPDDSVYWGITVNWLNSGSTPARNVKIGVSYRSAADPLPSDWDFDIPLERPPIFVAPSSRFASHPEFVVEPDQIVDAGTSKLNYYIWGMATYNDMFEGTPMHTTRFCVSLTGYGGNPLKYFDEVENPVRIYFTNSDRNQYFD